MINDRSCSIFRLLGICAAVTAALFLQDELYFSGRQQLIVFSLLFGAVWLVSALLQTGSSYNTAVCLLLLAACCLSAGYMTAQLNRFLQHTRFCNVGASVCAALLYLLFCTVLRLGHGSAARFTVLAASALLLLYGCMLLFGRDTVSLFRLSGEYGSLTGSGDMLAAVFMACVPGMASCRLHPAYGAGAAAVSGIALMSISQSILGSACTLMRYPVYQAWLCLDSVILQRLDGIVFCCVMLLCMIQLVQSAAAVSSMLEMQGRRSEKVCRALAAFSAASVLLFSGRFGSLLLPAAAAATVAAAVINAACVFVLRRKGSDEAKN